MALLVWHSGFIRKICPISFHFAFKINNHDIGSSLRTIITIFIQNNFDYLRQDIYLIFHSVLVSFSILIEFLD